jgi:hypothetical protein
MKRTISSTAQSAFKILVLFFCGVLVITTVEESLTTGRFPWQFIFPFGVMLGLFFWFAVSRKTVQMDSQYLYVSVFRRVVQIPLAQIASVTEVIGNRDRAVTIHFRSETPYGRAITFTPTMKIDREPHPIVTELSSYVETGS